MLIFCDESGAKGQATNAETSPGELGVFAGYVLRDDQVQEVSAALSGFIPATDGTGKLHITDLQPAEQGTLRDSIFKYFLEHRIPCLYEAIYVAGFHADFLDRQQALENAKKSRRSPIRLNVRAEVEFLHHALFQGLMAKGMAYHEESGFTDQLTAVLDNVDKPIAEIFVEKTEELLSVEQPQSHLVKAYDLSTKTPLRGEVRSTVKLPPTFKLAINTGKVTVSIQPTPDPFTLAADVLANSFWYHFNEINQRSLGAPLHNAQAVQTHQLRAVIWGLLDDWMSDTLYAHPARRQK
jgi:hypothetical protein